MMDTDPGPHCHWPNFRHYGEACHCQGIGKEGGPYIVTLPKPLLKLRHCEFCNTLYDPKDEKEGKKHEYMLTHGAFMTKETYMKMVRDYMERVRGGNRLTQSMEESIQKIHEVQRSVRAINIAETALQRMDDSREDDKIVDLAGEIGWGEKPSG